MVSEVKEYEKARKKQCKRKRLRTLQNHKN